MSAVEGDGVITGRTGTTTPHRIAWANSLLLAGDRLGGRHVAVEVPTHRWGTRWARSLSGRSASEDP